MEFGGVLALLFARSVFRFHCHVWRQSSLILLQSTQMKASCLSPAATTRGPATTTVQPQLSPSHTKPSTSLPRRKSSLGLIISTATVTATATPLPASNHNATVAAVGVGLGLPLGLALLIMISLFIMERRRYTALRRKVDPVIADGASNTPIVANPTPNAGWLDDRKNYDLPKPPYGSGGGQVQVMPTVHELRSVTPQFELDARPSSRVMK
ncbi:hypothetical protein MMC13_004340 [Lambiella insularis]|nr:hypothetical protein [Lambiella insularis]